MTGGPKIIDTILSQVVHNIDLKRTSLVRKMFIHRT